jgi:hypothetical protein
VKDLVKVTFKPWDEVVIHESMYYSFEDLVKLVSLGVQPGGLAQPLQWAEGVAFIPTGMPPTDEIIKEQLLGRIHWNSLSWALMSKYASFIPIKDISAKIPIVDVSANTILCTVVKALKGQAQK